LAAYIFVGGSFETLHHIIYCITKHEQRNHNGVKVIYGKFNDFAKWE